MSINCKMETYKIVCRETGDIICDDLSYDMATYMVHEYECQDKINGNYVVDFYEIIVNL